MAETTRPQVACLECGLIQQVPSLPERHRARCARCGSIVYDPWRASWGNRMCGASAISALILYVPAISLPILTIERMGHRNVSSVWNGVVQFLTNGDYFVGGVVLVCSVIIPLLKLIGLLLLVTRPQQMTAHSRARLFRMIEWSGKWGMLDVLLIAILVAWVKMGDLVAIQPGKAVIVFCMMVFMSLMASAFFDPQSIWKQPSQTNQ